MANTAKPQTGTSEDTKTIVTVLLLIFFYPVGMILMWVWTKWPVWLKVILTLPVTLFVIGIVAAVALVAVNPSKQLEKARQAGQRACLQSCNNLYTVESEKQTCINTCSIQYSISPAVTPLETSGPTQ